MVDLVVYRLHRLALNYKGLSYKTVWVEYPDIEPLCKEIGATPTAVRKNGTDYYSLPVISDPSTGKVVSDSYAIAKYLDETYLAPDYPALFPAGSHVLQFAFQKGFSKVFPPDYADLTLPPTCLVLNERSAEYYRRKNEGIYGCALEEVSPLGSSKREALWAHVKEYLDQLAPAFEANGKDEVFVMGDGISYADFTVVGWFMWGKLSLENEEWETLMGWNDGRWGRLMNACEKYAAVV